MRLAPAILALVAAAACAPPSIEVAPKSMRDHVPMKLAPSYARSKFANKRARKTSRKRKKAKR